MKARSTLDDSELIRVAATLRERGGGESLLDQQLASYSPRRIAQALVEALRSSSGGDGADGEAGGPQSSLTARHKKFINIEWIVGQYAELAQSGDTAAVRLAALKSLHEMVKSLNSTHTLSKQHLLLLRAQRPAGRAGEKPPPEPTGYSRFRQQGAG